jgi:hypothetical protein
MKNRLLCMLLTAAVPLCVSADDIRGADKLLCSTLQASICLPDEGCTTVPASALNIPQFINVDTRGKTLSTTAASGENRRTEVSSVERVDGLLRMHGYEQGRAFTLLVPELSGAATFASASEGRAVVVFAACTPVTGR